MPTRLAEPGSFEEVVCTVKVWRDKKTGVVISEEWRDQDREVHRFDGPAFIERDPSTGVVTKEFWAIHGKNHREGAAAVISRDAKSGKVIWSEWHRDGKKIPNPRRSAGKIKQDRTGPAPM